MLDTRTRRITRLLRALSAIETKLDGVFTKKNSLDFCAARFYSPYHSLNRLIGNTPIPI